MNVQPLIVIAMMSVGTAVVSLPAECVADPVVPAAVSGDAGRGMALYQACQACHAVDDNDLGPRHRGVVGRRAGRVADYNYSPALRDSGLVWDPATLDRWLADPSALVPGTKMFFRIDDAQSRADIIAYLKELR